MVKLSVVTGGITLSIELDNLEITVEDFKKKIEEEMPADKKITNDKQILYVKKKKLEAGKKLSEYISAEDEGVRIFVIKETKSALNNNKETNPNPYANNPPPTNSHPSNPYAQQQYPSFTPHPQQMGYPPHPQQMGYPPHPQQMGYPPNPQQMGFPQFPPQMGGGNNFKLSKEMIDMVMNNPGFFDQMIDVQTQGMTPEMKENFKQSTMNAFKMLQNDPSILDRINQMSGYGSPSFGSPQMNPYGGYNPYQPMPPQPMYYGGYPPYSPQPPQSPVLTTEQYKTQYSQQLSALKDMGFGDEEENLKALIKAHGDINYALDLLRKDANFPQN